MDMESIWDIHIWNLSTYDTQAIDQNARNFLVKFLADFQRKRVQISIIYQCNFKIVKICQKCAYFESGSLSEKLLRIEKSSSKSYKLLKDLSSRICLGLDLNCLAETLFSFGCVLHLASVTSITPIQRPDSLPRLPAPPYLHSRTSRETQSLVSLDARRFSSGAIQLLSPKRVNFLISFPNFLLLCNETGRILCCGMLEESRWTCLKSQ